MSNTRHMWDVCPKYKRSLEAYNPASLRSLATISTISCLENLVGNVALIAVSISVIYQLARSSRIIPCIHMSQQREWESFGITVHWYIIIGCYFVILKISGHYYYAIKFSGGHYFVNSKLYSSLTPYTAWLSRPYSIRCLVPWYQRSTWMCLGCMKHHQVVPS